MKELRIVYKDFNTSFQELLTEDNSLNIHDRNLQKLVTEIFKVKNGLSPELMNDVFEFIEKLCSLRTTSNFRSKKDPYNKMWHRNTFLPWPQITGPRCK